MELSKVGQLEALLFASGDPLAIEKMASILHLSLPDTEQLLQELSVKYATPDSGLMLRQVAGGWQLVTRQEAIPVIRELHEQQEIKLSNAAMETLAIVAYKQPVTKSEIEAIRGVKVDGVVNTLTDLELILEVGRKEVIGRPILYGTTEKFLVTFGLESLNDLPELPEELLDQPAPAEAEANEPESGSEAPETSQIHGD
jgi:segregation and condensation protein B